MRVSFGFSVYNMKLNRAKSVLYSSIVACNEVILGSAEAICIALNEYEDDYTESLAKTKLSFKSDFIPAE